MSRLDSSFPYTRMINRVSCMALRSLLGLIIYLVASCQLVNNLLNKFILFTNPMQAYGNLWSLYVHVKLTVKEII